MKFWNFSSLFFSFNTLTATPLRDATSRMDMYDAIEHGADDRVERRPRTFTLSQLLVACVAVFCCALAVTTIVNTPRESSSHAHLGASSVFTGNLGSCAFVANNPTNLPMGGGPKIDAHETVVRFNNFWERRIPDKRKGTKVDLLVMSENKGPDAAIHSKAQFKEFKKNYGGKCYISDRSLYQHRRGSPIYWWNSKEIRETGCEIIPRRVYDACMRGLKDQYNATQNFPHVIPTTGMLGVMHIGHRCASIALYGFTLPEPPYPTFPRVPHLFAEEHAVLKSVFPKAVFH